MREMFDRVAGVDDIEAICLERYLFDAALYEFRPLQSPAGSCHALVWLDGCDPGLWGRFQKSAHEAAAIRADIQNGKVLIEICVSLQRGDGRLRAKAFAVADIAPIGAT
jgi:hypothetical protein